MKENPKHNHKIFTFTFVTLILLWGVLGKNCRMNLLDNSISFAQTAPLNQNIIIHPSKRGYSAGEKVIMKIKIATESLLNWGENNFTASINDPAGNQIWLESVTLSTLRLDRGPRRTVKFILSYQLPGNSLPGKHRIRGTLIQKDGEILEEKEIDFNVNIPTIEKYQLTRTNIKPGEDTLFKIEITNPNPIGETLFDWQLDIIGPKGTDTIKNLSAGRLNLSALNNQALNIPFQEINEPCGDYSALLSLKDTTSGIKYDQQEAPLHIGELFLVTLNPKKRSYAPGGELSIAVNKKKIADESFESISINGEIRDLEDKLIEEVSNFSFIGEQKNKSSEEYQWQTNYTLPSDIMPGRYRFLGQMKRSGEVIGHCSKVFQVRSNLEIDLKRVKVQISKSGETKDSTSVSLKNISLQNRAKNSRRIIVKALLEDFSGLPLGEQAMELDLSPKKKKTIKSLDFPEVSKELQYFQLILSIIDDKGTVLDKEEKTVRLD